MPSAPHSIAMISVHSSPIGRLGTQDTGGMSVYIRELSRQLGRDGHAVDIFTRAVDEHASGEALRIAENVRLICLELGPGGDVPKVALFPYLSGFFRAMERFRRREGLAYDLIHSHYWLSGQVGRWARRAWGAPHVTTFHTLGAVKNLVCGPGSEPEVRLGVERGLANASDRMLITSERERENLIRFYDAEPTRMALVPCGVNFEVFRPMDRDAARRRIGAGRDEKIILYVGRFTPEKGLARLLQAVGRLKDIDQLRLIVVGGDGERDVSYRRMLELSRSCGIADRVTFKGRMDQADLPPYYNAADLLALPSSYESFGMVALEALACGTPVAATRVGAMEDLLSDVRSGRLAPDLRPSSLAEAVRGLLRNRSATPQAAESIRRTVARYEWSRVAAEVLTIYRGCLAGAADVTQAPPTGIPPGNRPPAGCGYDAFTPAWAGGEG